METVSRVRRPCLLEAAPGSGRCAVAVAPVRGSWHGPNWPSSACLTNNDFLEKHPLVFCCWVLEETEGLATGNDLIVRPQLTFRISRCLTLVSAIFCGLTDLTPRTLSRIPRLHQNPRATGHLEQGTKLLGTPSEPVEASDEVGHWTREHSVCT